MNPALWVSKTGLEAQQNRLSTVSNNLANVSTTGFKRSRALFEDLFYQNIRQPGAQTSQDTTLPSGLMRGLGVRTVATQQIHTQGNLIQTENALDMAVQGRGFFEILRPDGTIAYTRNGEFHLSAQGELVMASGYPLQPGINIPENALSITIGGDGTVSVQVPGEAAPLQVGEIPLVDFVNPSGLQPIGENLFIESGASGPPQQGQAGVDGLGMINQGMLETSNVNMVEEMVNMIETQRAYEMNAKVISTADQMLQYANQQI